MPVQIKIWAKSGKSADDIKKALGMDKIPSSALKAHSNYKYYDQFLDEIDSPTMKTTRGYTFFDKYVHLYDAKVLKADLKQIRDDEKAIRKIQRDYIVSAYI
ncbi:hypothetical protein BBP00_00009700 [Phytophthora kernoviae]|uniref:RxLR effector protein n=1 Tax=Phytophthora kernoviae TaxID=325452 RepID=A0A3F2RBV3_9STRA|nr:hypothetical protein BBP00_00009700 [Phytophthora kernoviae]